MFFWVYQIIALQIAKYRTFSEIFGQLPSSNPYGELKTRVGGADRSLIVGQSDSSEARVIPKYYLRRNSVIN